MNFLKVLAIICITAAYTVWRVDQYKLSIIPEKYEKTTITIEGYISSIINSKPEINRFDRNTHSKASFEFVVTESDIKWQPQKLRLTWLDAPELQAGDIWQLHVKLMRPRNYYNLGSFNFERYCLYNHISATGYVVANQSQSYLGSDYTKAFITKMRQKLLYKLQTLCALRNAEIIKALTFGAKDSIPKHQNKILQDSGVAHLMSISGMHIGMVTSLVFIIVAFGVKHFATYTCKHKAFTYAAICALLVGTSYALLSGFAVATQRSIIMLGGLQLALLLRRKTSAWSRFGLALILVILSDPLVIFAPGFWLSFLAVAVLLYLFSNRLARSGWLQSFLLPQLAINTTLLPLSFGVFGQAASVALFTNLIAIPLVTLLILPLCLLGCITLPIPVIACSFFKLSDGLISMLLTILNSCTIFKPILYVVPEKFDLACLILATLSCLWLFAPRGIPGKWWSVLAFVPLLFPRLPIIAAGTVKFTLLDVGQGLAAVVRTKNYVLVYDTGAQITPDFDMGTKVVVPFLQRQGIHKVDMLMISHSDNDHIGGAQGLIDNVDTELVLVNDRDKLQHSNILPCQGPQQWSWDGVLFTILHPNLNKSYKKRNNQSCVLQIQAGSDRMLLTGDIEHEAELDLVAQYGSQLRSDILLIPHHGSKTSSSKEFLQVVQPKFSLVAAGYKNQYGHPKIQVLDLYADLRSIVLSTIQHGSITFDMGSNHAIRPSTWASY